jgi:chromosome segregation ATPase
MNFRSILLVLSVFCVALPVYGKNKKYSREAVDEAIDRIKDGYTANNNNGASEELEYSREEAAAYSEKEKLKEEAAKYRHEEKLAQEEEIKKARINERIKLELDRLKERRDNAKQAMKAAEERADQVNSENKDLTKEKESTLKEVAKLEEERRSLEKERNGLAQRNSHLRAEIKSLNERYKEAQREEIVAGKKHDAVAGENEKVEAVARELRDRVRLKEESVEALRSKTQDYESEIAKIRQENEDLKMRNWRADQQRKVLNAKAQVQKQRYKRQALQNRTLARRQ